MQTIQVNWNETSFYEETLANGLITETLMTLKCLNNAPDKQDQKFY